MYCSSCGVAVAQDLSYCKHCGTKLNEAKKGGGNQAAQIPPESLIWAIVAVFVVGLGCTIGLMAVMKEVVHFNDGLIAASALFVFLMMLLLEGVFVSLLFRRNRVPKEVFDTAALKEHTTFAASQARSLHEPAPTVTEHTTRNFEPIYSEQKTE
jgi:predicted amidophosphoribosyltransferase